MKNTELFKQIEKSLYDITSDAKISNPRLLTNTDKAIQNEIQKSFKWADRFDISVSYVVLSGLQRLIEDMKETKDSRFLTTTDGYVTTPEALQVLLNMSNIETRVYVPANPTSGFHAKTYMFHKGEEQKIMVGSANISNRAFGSVHETSLMVEVQKNGELYKRYQDNFDLVWKQSVVLNKEFIGDYRERYYAYKNATQNPEFWNRTNEIKPNSMQRKALKALESARADGEKKALIVASTGSGKTYLSAFDVQQFNPEKTLFLVHNRTILRKSIKTYRTIFEKEMKSLELKTKSIDRIGRYNFVFATPQTLSRHLDKVDPNMFDYIVVDEAHHTPASQYVKILDHFNPKFILGMTATPDRPDANVKARDVYAKYNHIIPYEIRLHDAIEDNLIAPFNYFGIGEDLAAEDVRPADKARAIIRNINKFGHFGAKLKALAFVDTIAEAENVAQELTEAGIYSVAVSGSTDSDEVDDYLEELGNDNTPLKIIVSVNKLNEGIDVPEINTILMLRKTQSSIIYIQQLGRGLRLSDPEKFVTVLDFVGNYAGSYAAIQGILDEHDATSATLKERLLRQSNLLSNIQLDEVSRKRIYESIDNGMKGTKTILRKEFKDWVDKYGYIPSMQEYEESKQRIDEILLHFDSYQELKVEAKYIELSQRAEDFFRHISQFILTAGTKRMVEQIHEMLIGNSVEVKDEYFKKYLLSEFKNIVMNRNTFFKEINGKIKLDIEDLSEDEIFDKEFKEFKEYITKHIRNNSKVLHKNYRRLTIPFMARRSSLANLLEGQFFKDGTFYCLPSLMKEGSDKQEFFGNKLIDKKTFMYVTKNDSNSKKIESGEYEPEFFVRHRDSKDTYLTYIGKGKLISVEGDYSPETHEHSKNILFELENEVPQWMVDDYQF